MQILIGLQIIRQIQDLINGENGLRNIIQRVSIRGSMRCGNALQKEVLME